MSPLLWAACGLVLGAVVGSFLATLILRWPEGRSVAVGRSACDHCGRSLRAIELVPVLSALAQRGRCRTCGGGIAPLHGRVEVGCAVIGATALGLAPGVEGAGWAVFGWLLLTLAVLDWRHFWLPDALTLPLAFLGLTLGMWVNAVALPDRVVGAGVGYLALLAVALGYRRLRRREGLGLGDAKLLGALGAWLGWQALPFLLLIACILALLVVGVSAALGNRLDAATRVPLGTFLCLAALPAWAARLALL